MSPVAPSFEDAFISRLRAESGDGAHELPAMPAVAESAGAGPAIRVEGVQRRFGDFVAVKGVSFEVHRGEVFGLLGANGAGKTTTFRMLCGLLPASQGHLEVAGHDLRRAAAQARGRIGYMAQRFSLYVNLTVQQNLRFFAAAYGLKGATRQRRIRWALDGFDLAGYADMASGDLPLGYKQRLAMAAALMHEPDILFLDEPTSGVDPLARREFWHRINLLAEQGVTVLITTHFMDEANYCDRLLVMADGETLAQGTPAEMKARFKSAEHPDPTMEDAFIGLMEQHR
jgi:ABC-2 type transport system ATP-binding protein